VIPLSIPSPDPAWRVFELGPIAIHMYAVCILIGIVAAAILTAHRLKRRGGDPGLVIDISLWAVPLGIIGARIFHVLTHPDDYFGAGKELWKVVAIWEGGNAIFGSLIGGAIGVFIACRLYGVRFWSFADALVPGLLIAQALGRFGNWFNEELFGLPTDLPWGLEVSADNPAFPVGLPEGTLFQPTFLYEVIWNLVGAALLILIERKTRLVVAGGRPSIERGAYRLQWGRLLAMYLIWYGVGRSVFESIRIDPSEIFFGIRTNVWAAFASILVGVIILIVQGRRHPGLEPSIYVPGREPEPTAIDSDDTYSESDDDNDAVPAGAGSNDRSESNSGTGPVTSGAGTKS
jgi:prolipoprotein diacylglyceryl transferase